MLIFRKSTPQVVLFYLMVDSSQVGCIRSIPLARSRAYPNGSRWQSHPTVCTGQCAHWQAC